jgi:hypothetical protein
MPKLDTSRHQEVFVAAAFENNRVDILGADRVAVQIALHLAKLGITNIHVWDAGLVLTDDVSAHGYGLNDIGKIRVVALQGLVEKQTATRVTAHERTYTADVEDDDDAALGEVVFMTTGDMAYRQSVWSDSLRYKLAVKRFFEVRWDGVEGHILSTCPYRPAEVRAWEECEAEAVPVPPGMTSGPAMPNYATPCRPQCSSNPSMLSASALPVPGWYWSL